MTKDDIIRMAKEAGQADGTTPLERSIVLYAAKSSLFLEKFADLIAAAEREACAKVCDEMFIPEESDWHWSTSGREALQEASGFIRDRGEK